MKAKLIKKENNYYLTTEKQTSLCYHLGYKELLEVKGVGEKSGEVHHNKGWNKPDEVMFIDTEAKLSKQNCDEIFGVTDVEELAEEDAKIKEGFVLEPVQVAPYRLGFRNGFNKAMELNKNKVFTLEDIKKAIVWAHDKSTEGVYLSRLPVDEFIQSLQQPTEIEVTFNPEEKDSEGCLILKKIED
jgi:hypothetical protein